MGTTAAFEVFAASAGPVLFRTAWVLTHDRFLSEDLVQEALARVYVKWRDRDGIDNPIAYARTTLVRLHISAMRRHSSTEVVSDTIETSSLDQDLAAKLTLHAALLALPAIDRAIVVLRYFDDLPVLDVAQMLHLTESAVRTRSSRAMARLRNRLGADFRTSAT